jgi:Uma2 family endonuclease
MRLQEITPRYELSYYLDFVETNRPLRFEYAGGHIYPIEAATPAHAAIEANIAAAILPQLKGTNCRGYGSSLVVIAGEDYASMPDFTVVYGEAILRRGKRGTGIANPVFIVEILSPSNKPYDRHGKFEQYKLISTFTDYLLIEQNDVCVEHWVKTAKGKWRMSLFEEQSDLVQIASINVRLLLSDIYSGIEL